MPAREMTATSVVPPPMSTIMFPVGSVIGNPAPIAAAIACSIKYTSVAPARNAEPLAVRFLDEILDHLLRHFEVGDDAVLHRTDGDDVARRAAEHFFRFLPDRFDVVVELVDGDDRRLAHDDAFVLRVD